MAAERLHEAVADYAREQEEHPLGGYATLMVLFASIATAFSVWMHRSGRELPERISPGDLALITVATHKASRLLAKDRVTSAVRAPFTRFQAKGGPAEVEEQGPRQRAQTRHRRAVDLPVLPGDVDCGGVRDGLAVVPRPTRWVASVLAAHFGSDVLQAAYRKLEDAA